MICGNRVAKMKTRRTVDLGLSSNGLSWIDLAAIRVNKMESPFEPSLNRLLQQKPGIPATAPDPTEEQPPLAAEPVTQSGALWQLGRHRLLCGSALERSSYQALMRDEIADLVFTDPPFNVRSDGHATGNGRIRHREGDRKLAMNCGCANACIIHGHNHALA
jgi:hypothetical protein